MHSMRAVTMIFLLYCLLFFPSDARKVEICSDQKDITTPLTRSPASSTPVLNPNSDPDSKSPVTMTLMTVPTNPVPAGGSCFFIFAADDRGQRRSRWQTRQHAVVGYWVLEEPRWPILETQEQTREKGEKMRGLFGERDEK
ncbi:hypothetical protein F3Y22_tig00014773pilonHSYRG00007 [Hibiscus syriacus]|uniref:Uncharacterized protein n=1 Tax=Hibiscus syriacus TaxID=106335 RepID=A0A6A3BYX4_HIBSY|nr:hypothetical protein F3Y22_tig00014773pilonHSYRG00007 [Hibiscus syriacus]